MAINISQAFKRTSANPVDESIALTKAQMLAVNDNIMPSKYFTVCQDDGFFYLYDKSNEVDPTTGKFRKFEGGGGGTSDYTDLENKPTINNVTLSGNKTTSDLGLAPSTVADTCYKTGDTAFTALADGDYIPVYDISESTKKKSTWSNVKSVLKTYFDTLYSTVTTSKSASSGGTALSLVTTGEKYTWGQKQNAFTAGTNLAFDGNTLNASMPVLGTIDRSMIFDTTEKVVGKWTNGKPLYQKVVNYGTLPNTDSKSVAHGISNLDRVIEIKGYTRTSSGNTYPIPATIPNINLDGDLGINTTSTNIVITSKKDYSSVTECYVVLCYTKTTDAANSYNYANENDYSTTEKIVGTWIDGKKIYQKTFTGTMPTVATDGTAVYASVIIDANIDFCVNMFGVIKNTSSTSKNVRPFPFAETDAKSGVGSVRASIYLNSTGALTIASDLTGLNNREYYITVQYTKS